MTEIYSFGEWIKQRRTHLRFSQRAIAEQVFCSTAMIKKIDRGSAVAFDRFGSTLNMVVGSCLGKLR